MNTITNKLLVTTFLVCVADRVTCLPNDRCGFSGRNRSFAALQFGSHFSIRSTFNRPSPFDIWLPERKATFFLSVVACLFFVFSSLAQGTINFWNLGDPSARLSTNDFQGHAGFTTGVNAYRIGFYMAPFGTTDEAVFTLVLPVATNSSVFSDGRFNGNPGPFFFQIPGNTGQTIAFQIRAWSLFAGNTAEEARNYNGPLTVYYGQSAIGFTTPETGSGSPPNL